MSKNLKKPHIPTEREPGIRIIDATSNPQYKIWLSLIENSGIKKNGLCLISGRKIVPELLKSRQGIVALLTPSPEALKDLNWPSTTHVFQLKKDLFNSLDVSGTRFPLIVARTPRAATAEIEEPPLGLELVLALSDPNNLGAVIRSAEAFQVKKIILLKECANPFLPKVLRASSGSSFRVPIAFGPSILSISKKAASMMLGLDRKGDTLSDFKWPENCRILLGEEGQGLPKDLLLGTSLSIPMAPRMDSLNATVAASIVMYKYFESSF